MIRIALRTDVPREGDTAVPPADLGPTQFAAIKIDPHQSVSRLGRIGTEKDNRFAIFGRPRTAFRKKHGRSRHGMSVKPAPPPIRRPPLRAARPTHSQLPP